MDKYKKYKFYNALGANPIMYIITDNLEDVEKVLEEHPDWHWSYGIIW